LKKKRLRFREISQSRNRYPKGGRTNPTDAPETPISEAVRAEVRALDARGVPDDPKLTKIVEAWPGLPTSVRAEILRLAGLPAERE
jgi:hypothetical protein